MSRTRVTLKKHGDVLELVPPPTKVNNLIFGRTWVDSPGEMVLSNLTTGDKVVLYFQPCGWFGYYTLSHLLFLLTTLLLSNVCFLQLYGLLFDWMKIMYCFHNLVLHFVSRRERREAVCCVWLISMCFLSSLMEFLGVVLDLLGLDIYASFFFFLFGKIN